ncbi:MAG TPA: amino acid racemase [Clostridiales bacterium]|nr:amino acid racemase [Clostridiales bacterium]
MGLGVIGGLGPMATVYFMELVIKMTEAQCDQEHLEMIVYNCPTIPDRTSYILGHSQQNPVEPMIRIGKQLAAQGVECIAIPCITAHYFYDILSESINADIIHAVKETTIHLKENGIRTVGIAATDGTIASGLFQKELTAAGIGCVIPSGDAQQDIMDVIYKDIKASQPIQEEKLYSAFGEMRKNGAEVIILGCTELSLVKRDYNLGAGYIDVLDILAKESVLRCGKKLREQYKCLISGKC